jgi:hypothetical protein
MNDAACDPQGRFWAGTTADDDRPGGGRLHRLDPDGHTEVVLDGLTVDAAGDVWVAIFGGGQIERYSPDGVLREELHVPARETTSCAFAGPGLHRLYVTTATDNWSDEQRRPSPGPASPTGSTRPPPAARPPPSAPTPTGGRPSSRSAAHRPALASGRLPGCVVPSDLGPVATSSDRSTPSSRRTARRVTRSAGT